MDINDLRRLSKEDLVNIIVNMERYDREQDSHPHGDILLAARGAFSVLIAKEIESSARQIDLFLDFVRNNLDEDSPAKGYTQDAVEELKRMRLIASKLSMLGAVQNEDLRQVSISDIFKSKPVTDMLRNIENLGHRVLLETSNVDQIVNVSMTVIIESVLNIISNANEAMAHKEGALSIAVSSQSHGNDFFAAITVSDTGTGIPGEHIGMVFEPFFTTKGKSHAGLGCTVAHSVIRAHGGSIGIASEVGSGTRIKIYLPAVLSSDS